MNTRGALRARAELGSATTESAEPPKPARRHSDVMRERSAAARAMHVLGASDPSLILQADAANPDMAKPLPVRDFEDALATLRDGDGAAAGTFREECQRRFPGADFLNN